MSNCGTVLGLWNIDGLIGIDNMRQGYHMWETVGALENKGRKRKGGVYVAQTVRAPHSRSKE